MNARPQPTLYALNANVERARQELLTLPLDSNKETFDKHKATLRVARESVRLFCYHGKPCITANGTILHR